MNTMDEDISRVCRLCMREGAASTIFKIVGGLSLDAKATSVTSLSILQGDGLPDIICELCETTVDDFYTFKRKCEEADSALRSTLKRFKEEETIKTEPPDEADAIVKMEVEDAHVVDFEPPLKKCEVTPKRLHNLRKLRKLKKTRRMRIKRKLRSETNKDAKESSEIKKIIRPALPYQCESCGKMFKMKSILNKHKVTHTGEKSYKCPLCPKQYTRAEHRVVHMRSHTGVKPFTCEVCSRSFAKKQDLSRHHRIHSDEKKFPCLLCDRKFKRSADVHSHMRTHTGMRPFACKICTKNYASYSGLSKHIRTNCKTQQAPAPKYDIHLNGLKTTKFIQQMLRKNTHHT